MILFILKNYIVFFFSCWVLLGFALAIEIMARVYRFVFKGK